MSQGSSNSLSGKYPLELFWDATYAIVVSLMEEYPDTNPENMGLEEVAKLVTALPGFLDDPDMSTDQILIDILTAWYEEYHQ